MNAPIPINAMARTIPPAAIMFILTRYSRTEIEGFISVAIDLLDFTDGDPDVEPNGDEGDGTGAEDEAGGHTRYGSGPGCSISDPDHEHDGREHEEGY